MPIMKTLIKCLSSQEECGTKKDMVKMYEENGIFSVEYKYTSMNEYKVIKTNSYDHALVTFLKRIMFVLS